MVRVLYGEGAEQAPALSDVADRRPQPHQRAKKQVYLDPPALPPDCPGAGGRTWNTNFYLMTKRRHVSGYYRTAFGAEPGAENGPEEQEMMGRPWWAFRYPLCPRTRPRIILPALRPAIRETESGSQSSKRK